MNKLGLVKEVASELGFTQKDVKAVLEATQDVVFKHLKDEGGVKVFDGVVLEAVYKEAHEGRNPQTGEVIQIDAKYAPHAKFGAAVKAAIN